MHRFFPFFRRATPIAPPDEATTSDQPDKVRPAISLSSFPAELLEHICRYLSLMDNYADHNSLAMLCLSSRTLLRAGRPILFQHMTLWLAGSSPWARKDSSSSNESLASHNKSPSFDLHPLNDLLIRDATLARRIRTLEVSVSYDTPNYKNHYPFSFFLSLEALENMSNLEEFRVVYGVFCGTLPPERRAVIEILNRIGVKKLTFVGSGKESEKAGGGFVWQELRMFRGVEKHVLPSTTHTDWMEYPPWLREREYLAGVEQ